MIYDPKRSNVSAFPPPANCSACGKPFIAGDRIVPDEDSTRAVVTYWHRECLTRHTEDWMAEQDRKTEAAAARDPTIARLLAALRRAE